MKYIITLFSILASLAVGFAVDFNYKIDSDRWNGFCFKMFLNSDKTVSNWKIKFNLSNASISSKRWGKFNCNNWSCVVKGLSRNDPLKPGQKVEVGFCAKWQWRPSNVAFIAGDTSSISQNSSSNSNSWWSSNNSSSSSSSVSVNPQTFQLSKNGLSVNVKVQSKRDDGYCRKVILKNTGKDKIIDWKLSFVLNKDFSSFWSANYKKTNSGYEITPKSWNKEIKPSEEVTFGFCVKNATDTNWKIIDVQTQQGNSSENTWNASWDNNVGNTNDTIDNTNNNVNDSFDSFENVWKLVASYPESQWPTYKSSNLILEINPWNIVYPAKGYAKIYYDSTSNIVTYLQDLTNIKIQNPGWYVLGYPEVYVGNKPWNGNYVDAGSKLPAKIDELKSLTVQASWKYDHPNDLSCNFAMEGWFTKNKFQKSGVGQWEVEMMIMWYRNIQWAAWSKVWETTIPVVVNWKEKNITFDIYKAQIGWDFVTFIPHNYKDFKNASIKFDILDFAKVAEKYVPQIKDLYLEDWEFWTEFWTPSTTQAKLAWQITKFKVTGIKQTATPTPTPAPVTEKSSFIFAPYVDSTLYPFPLLSKISQQTNNYNYVLGFVVSNRWKCEPSWGGYYDINSGPYARIDGKNKFLYDEIKAVQAKWGIIIPSFGWQAGTPLFRVCDSNQLANVYKTVLEKLNTNYLDLDIEGAAIKDKQHIDSLIQALKQLKNVKIYFTLPVMPEWLTQDGLYIVKKAFENKIPIAWINLMTMDYGWSYNQDMGNYAIQAANSVANQIKQIVPSMPDSKIMKLIGITPMIGLNDITTENFTLEDAQQVASYVRKNRLWRLSYWSLNRDHPCSSTSVATKCSSLNNQTKDYEYLLTFKKYLTSGSTTTQTYSDYTSVKRKKVKTNVKNSSSAYSVPLQYKQLIDNFFEKLKLTYTGSELQSKLALIRQKVKSYLNQNLSWEIKAVLQYIYEKASQ